MMGSLKRRIIEDMEPTEYELARRWIPVSERLPGDLERVLVFCALLEPDEIVGATRAASGIWECDDGQILGETEPTHWMPLPAPPTDAK